MSLSKAKISILTLFLISFVIISSCANQQLDQDEDLDTQVPSQQPQQPQQQLPDQVQQPDQSTPSEPAEQDQKDTDQIFSGMRCNDKKIEAYITNIDPEMNIIGDTVKLIVSGIVINDPICDKYELKPGETTYCQNIAGDLAKIRPSNLEGEVTVIMNYKSNKKIIDKVVCS